MTNIPNDESDFLEHHGILGMRWGVRRYQNPDGSYTSAGKKRRRSFRIETREEKAERLAKKAAKKEAGRVRKVEKQQKRSAEEAAKIERKKFQLMRSGNADSIYKNRHLFSDQELNQVLSRIKTQDEIRSRGATAQREAAKSKKDSKQSQQNKKTTLNGMQIVQNLAKQGNTLVGAYGTYNKLAKSLNSITGKETLPVFEGRVIQSRNSGNTSSNNQSSSSSNQRDQSRNSGNTSNDSSRIHSAWDISTIDTVFNHVTNSDNIRWSDAMSSVPMDEIYLYNRQS